MFVQHVILFICILFIILLGKVSIIVRNISRIRNSSRSIISRNIISLNTRKLVTK